MAMIPVCEQEQVPLIVTGPAVSPFKKWIFLIGAGDVRGAEHIAEFAVRTLGAKRIAVLHDSANYGITGMKNLAKDIPRLAGASIVVEEQFGPSDTNMVPQLSKIKAATPDLIILYATGASAAVVAKNYRQLGMTVPVLGAHGVPTPGFLKLAGKTAEEHKWVMIGTKIRDRRQASPGRPLQEAPVRSFFRIDGKVASRFLCRTEYLSGRGIRRHYGGHRGDQGGRDG